MLAVAMTASGKDCRNGRGPSASACHPLAFRAWSAAMPAPRTIGQIVSTALLVALSASSTAVSAELSVGPAVEKGLELRGPNARQQLVVTSTDGGQEADVTRRVSYAAEPSDVVAVDATGLVTPRRDGHVAITAKAEDGASSTIKVTVTGFQQPLPINFKNEIVPIFTKLGCNGGGCHGKASGQNGFRLSLLGFVPEDDYEYLVKESRGRRLFPAAPAESLLIQKAIGRMPHGGGKRLDADSHEYRLLVSWIEQGMPFGGNDDPIVTSIECHPSGRVMQRGGEQQISIIAHYSDGHSEDVTRTALYEPNDAEMAECSATGLVKTLDLAGEVAIMARYQGQVATFRATLPLGEHLAEVPAPANVVDEAVFAKLKLLGIPPSAPCDDATFLRRVSLDVTGRLPTAEEARAFLADSDPAKREHAVDRLLDSAAYADLFANKWNLVLRNKRRGDEDKPGTYAFHRWIWQSIYQNKPFDQFVREILTASGSVSFNPAVVWYREVNSVEEQVEDTAQLFLGMRIQCARCHHHPFEKWSEDDYYGMAAFFSRVGSKDLPVEAVSTAGKPRDKRLFHNPGRATARNPRSGKELVPTGLGGVPLEIPADADPRVALADWMTEPSNPFFAKSVVNRYWKHFFSRGLVEPEDDMRATNPPTNPELLDSLARHFIDSGYDLKELVRTIVLSKTYQLSAEPNDRNSTDKQNFSRFYPKRLSAEALYDGFHQVTGTEESYGGLPPGTNAMQLADPTIGPYFLKVFGQPQADTACECERSQEANLAQSLHLLNSSEVQNKISSGNGRAATLAKDMRPPEEKVSELYLSVYGRQPDAEELKIAIEHIASNSEKPQAAYEDLVWALVNTKEFLFNH